MADKSPRERLEEVRLILQVSDEEIAAAKSTTQRLSQELGPLMSAVTQRLVRGEGAVLLFDDNEEAATAFKNQLTQFVLKATAAEFSEDYCDYVAGFAKRFDPMPPMQAFSIVFATIAEWLVVTVTDAVSDRDQRNTAIRAWQKLMALNLDLLLSAYEA